jgi:membrane associated rhomboid family serine protease
MTLIDRFKSSNIIVKLIAVNALVFVVANVVFAFLALSGEFSFELASWNSRLGGTAQIDELIVRPWTVVTYMFTHFDFGHIFWNMIILFFLGKVFLHLLDPRKMLSVYLMGGLAGFVLFLVAYNVFPVLDPVRTHMVGASASIMAIVLAAATYSPNYSIQLVIFGPVKMWLIGVVYVLADIAAIKYFDNTGGHLAHLGGAAYGILWASQMKKGKNIGGWMERLVDKLANLFKKGIRTKMKVVKNERRGGKTDAQFNVDKKASQAKVDSILDKISKSGYDSLTKAEKDILFKQGDS